MKIVFICGSLEPGKDGVGDYTRRLAGELIRQGNEARILALNDKDVKEISEESQNDDKVKICVLRIPTISTSKKRFFVAKEWINSFDPKWISLQYVPFGFQDKGLPFALGRQLKALSRNSFWHIMFHESWVGTDVGASPKMIWWGRLQRQVVKLMLKKLKPKSIHTQTHIYLKQLKKLGCEAEYLPLFSSFPFREVRSSKKKPAGENSRHLSFVVFGSIHPGAPIKQFAKELSEYGEKYNLYVNITFVGRNGSELENWLSILQGQNTATETLGEQPPDHISQVLSEAKYGISTTPVILAEKSSVIATMLEHELPVICLRQIQIKGFENETTQTTVLAYESGNLEKLLQQDFICKKNDVQMIAKELLKSLDS